MTVMEKKDIYILTTESRSVLYPFDSSLRDRITNIIKGNQDEYFRESNIKRSFIALTYTLIYFLHTYTFDFASFMFPLMSIYYYVPPVIIPPWNLLVKQKSGEKGRKRDSEK